MTIGQSSYVRLGNNSNNRRELISQTQTNLNNRAEAMHYTRYKKTCTILQTFQPNVAQLLFRLTGPKEEDEAKSEVTVRKAVETTSMEIQVTKTEEKGTYPTHPAHMHHKHRYSLFQESNSISTEFLSAFSCNIFSVFM